MIQWAPDITIFLHRDPVDFRKAINGLSVIVQEQMGLSPFERAIFVFRNKHRSQLKVLYWDDTGFALWQKRLEQDKFPWPQKPSETTISLTLEQWQWLLRGLPFDQFKPHKKPLFNATN